MDRMKLWKAVMYCSTIVCMFWSLAFTSRAGEEESMNRGKGEIIFLLDTSSSMNRQDSDRYVMDAIRQAAYGLPSGYKVGLVAYNTGIQAVVAPGTDMGPLEAALDGMEYTGYTNAGQGLAEAEKLFSDETGIARYIIMLSDGEIDMPDEAARESSMALYREAVLRAKERGIRILIVAIGTEMGQGMHIFDGAELTGGAIYWEGQSGTLSRIMERIVTERFSFPWEEVGITDAGGGSVHALLPPHAARIRIVLTGSGDVTGVLADYGAEKGRTITGKRFAVLDMERPSSEAAKIRFETEDVSGIKAYMLVEYEAEARVEAAYRIEALPQTEEEIKKGTAPVYEHFADVKIWLEDAGGRHENLWLEEAMEGQEIPCTINGAAYMGVIGDGYITTVLPADDIDAVEVSVDMTEQPYLYDMGTSPAAELEKYPDPVPDPPPDYRPLWIALALLLGAGLGIVLWWVKKKNTTIIYMAPAPGDVGKQKHPPGIPLCAKSRTIIRKETAECTFCGRLSMYVVRTRDGRDIPPQTYRLFGRGDGRLTLDRILTDCGIRFGKIGAEDIILYPGPDHNMILMDQSERCTVMRGSEIMKKGMGYPVSYHEKVTVTFEDEMTEMEIHYKNLKPSEREALK